MMKNTIVINTILIITGGFKIFETVKQLTNGGPNHMSDVLVTYMYLILPLPHHVTDMVWRLLRYHLSCV